MSNQEKPTYASASDLFHRALSCADRGDMQQAEDLYQASIRQYEQLYDDQYEIPPQILAALGNLALVYADIGRYDQEARALEKALAYGREFARCDENFLPRVVELENDLALSYSRQGLFPRAEEHYLAALEANAKTLSESGEEVSERALLRSAVLHNNLAVFYEKKTGDLTRAEEHYRAMLSDRRQLFRLDGNAHGADLKEALSRVAEFCRLAGRPEGAKALLEEAQGLDE